MNIASALITILGPAIARVILTLVLKPLIGEKFISDVSEEITGGLKDLLIPFLPNDEWAQHRGTRIFEDIGEEVAYSLQSVYQIEGSRYAEGEWLVVTKAVAQTLTRHISGTLLSSREWDKKSLSHYLLKADPNAVHSQEWELYKRVIEETSRRIIEVSIDLLPLITAQDMARLFSTTDIIRATTTETLSLVQKIYEESRVQNQETLEAIFEQNYREEIARNFDRVELLGVDSLRGTNRKQKLTVAYVSLHFEGSDIEFGKKQHNDALKSNSQSNKLVSVVDFLSKSSRLLISADAGFGKTTLLKWIAVHASQADFSANLQGMNEKVPIFIRLRSFAKEDSKLPTPLDFLKDSAPNSSEEASKGWITKKLRNGKAIILIDGLDEVGINRREQVFDWLHGLLEGFEQSTFIVTTRPYVLDQDASNYFAKKGFQAASIQRLSEMGTNELIDNWYKAVAIEEDANEQEQEQLSMLANKLKEQLTFNDSLKQLARIPLLTAILCALNRQYQRSLPEDRITLYEKCIETLLEGREKARNISLPDYPDLPLQVKQELMSSLAYWMLRNNYLGEASAAEAEKHFDSILQQLGQGITGHDALMLFKDRLSFLHSPTYENVGFIHRSFQDYFSSREIVKIRDFGNLLEHIEDDNWRDVLILTAGQASQPDLTQILDRVFSLAKLKKSIKARRGLQLLGLSCLERKPRMTELLEQQVLACFEELQFPHSKEETFLFSNVGNLAIHSLKNRPNLSNAQKALCIDTLALIGSTVAFDEISKYSKEKDWEVVNSLGFAIRYFDKVKYSKKVLSINILTSHKLVVPSTSLFSDIIQHINLVHLKELDIKSGDNFEILYSISDNSEIQSLYINNNPTLTDISPVKSLKHLRSLDIRNNFNLREISPLSTLENLDYLDIRANSNLLNIAPLGSLSSLRVLDLRSCPRIKNFNVIAKLVNLESLDLRNNPQLSNVDFLERLPKLKTLYLGNNPLIKELSVILNLPILEWLWVDKDLKVPISLESKINVFRS